jgi:demethylspheroidene O-methyltransferase
LDFQSRLLRDPKIVRLAEKFPLTRPVARREARALFDICAGFVYSQTLFACVKVGIFEALADGALDEPVLARRIGLEPDAARRLLTASTALRLTRSAGPNRWGLGRLGAAMLASPGLAAMVEHHAVLYRDLADPVRLLKGQGDTALSTYWPYAREETRGEGGDGDVASYTQLMAATQPAIAAEILDAVPLRRFKSVMDAGGGNGAFLIEAAKREPSADLMLFELPAVAALAKERFKEMGLHSRVRVFEGDLRRGPMPGGANAITLIRIILDHDNVCALDILKTVRKALPPGGTLIVAEPMAGTSGAESVGAYFALYLLAMGGGRPRTKAELTALLREAGFSKISEKRTCQPLLTRILLAQ